MKKTVIAGCVVAMLAYGGGMTRAAAQIGTKQLVPEKYTGTTANMASGAGSKIVIQIFQWSSDADRERVLSSVGSSAEKDSAELVKALASLPTIGHIWAAGPAGYALKYAHRLTDADGSERVVVLTDRPLGSLEHPAWKTAAQVVEPANPYTVVELHLDRKGRGNGKMSLTTPVTVDEQTKTVRLANYDTASTLLTDVQHHP